MTTAPVWFRRRQISSWQMAPGKACSDLSFLVQSFADGAALLDALDTAIDADVIILDWKLPETSGIDLLTELRRRATNLPVVF